MTTDNGARLRTLARVGAAAFVTAALVAACGSSSKVGTSSGSGTPTGTSTSTSTSGGGGAGTTAAAAAGTITIKNFAFSALTVKAGAKVTVVNADQAPHTVTGGGSSGFDTGTIQGGSSGSFTAPTAPGNYAYICSVHPYMHGTLVVTS